MGILSNPRHERFAQALAAGKSADEAYTEAGYQPNRGNASTLKANQNVEARVAELQERGAKRTEITISTLTDMFLEDRKDARGAGQFSAAVSAVDKLARLHGHMVEKQEVDQTTKIISDRPLTADEWEQRYAADLGAPGGAAESLN